MPPRARPSSDGGDEDSTHKKGAPVGAWKTPDLQYFQWAASVSSAQGQTNSSSSSSRSAALDPQLASQYPYSSGGGLPHPSSATYQQQQGGGGGRGLSDGDGDPYYSSAPPSYGNPNGLRGVGGSVGDLQGLVHLNVNQRSGGGGGGGGGSSRAAASSANDMSQYGFGPAGGYAGGGGHASHSSSLSSSGGNFLNHVTVGAASAVGLVTHSVSSWMGGGHPVASHIQRGGEKIQSLMLMAGGGGGGLQRGADGMLYDAGGEGGHRGTQLPRATSLPNMGHAYQRATLQSEEEKRKKRLERNRESARLRRQRKKNLVDSYEIERQQLELNLQKLKGHKWGHGQAQNLVEALGMERGQQQLLKEEQRRAVVSGILQQQMGQIDVLAEVQLDAVLLNKLAAWKNWGGNRAPTPPDGTREAAQVQIFRELDAILELSGSQSARIAAATEALQAEVAALQAVKAALRTLHDGAFLNSRGVERMTGDFLKILNPSQVSKFLIWTDQNSEGIETLDYVNAPRSGAGATAGPTFFFGNEEGGDDGGDGDD